MAGSKRLPRVNDLLRSEISEMITRHLKDPRVTGMVSVTEVDTSADLRHARVYVSVFGTDDERKSTLEALRHASGFLRHEVAQRVTFRHMPELDFQLDSSLERGDRILRLLKEAQAADAALAKATAKPRRRASTNPNAPS